MTRTSKLFILACCGMLLAIVAGSADAKSKEKAMKPEELQEKLENLPCSGLKPRVAIYSFYATGKIGSFEGYNVGGFRGNRTGRGSSGGC